MAKPCTPRPIAQRVQLFELPDRQCRGSKGHGPLPFSGGTKGDILFEREYPLWCRGAHAAPPSHPCEKSGPSRGSPLCPVQRHRRCPPPRTFVQKIKKRRLFQPSLLYLHYCKTFLLPWVAFMRSSLLRMRLADAQVLGRDLKQLVVGEELEALLQAHLLGRDKAQRVVASRKRACSSAASSCTR